MRQTDKKLVWDEFFDLHAIGTGHAKYSLRMLAAMEREEYRNVVEEYFAFVYFNTLFFFASSAIFNMTGLLFGL
jgi:hypothetical protein